MKNQTPQHVAIICDGNRTWARNKGLPAFEGHRAGVNQIAKLVEHAIKRQIKYLTFWVFSTENWQREPVEIQGLMNLFRMFFDREVKKLNRLQARLYAIGDLKRLDQDIQDKINQTIKSTQNNKKINIIFAVSYGGRDEIKRAVQKIAQDVQKNKIKISQISEQLIANYLDTKDIPDPDLIIRTGGHYRLSGFLSWQNQYSEFYFPQTRFPDLDEEEFDKALKEYFSRKRKFGK